MIIRPIAVGGEARCRGPGRSDGFAAGLAAFDVAEPFFLVSDSVGEGLEPGAEVGDLSGESGEGVWVVAVAAVFFDDGSELRVAVEGGAADAGVVGDGGRRLADQYVDGATCNAAQTGSTPNSARFASMNSTVIAVGGRAPPRKKSPPAAGSRFPAAARGSPGAAS